MTTQDESFSAVWIAVVRSLTASWKRFARVRGAVYLALPRRKYRLGRVGLEVERAVEVADRVLGVGRLGVDLEVAARAERDVEVGVELDRAVELGLGLVELALLHEDDPALADRARVLRLDMDDLSQSLRASSHAWSWIASVARTCSAGIKVSSRSTHQ